jgi:hypothetical protein
MHPDLRYTARQVKSVHDPNCRILRGALFFRRLCDLGYLSRLHAQQNSHGALGEHGHSFDVCESGANNTPPNRIYCFHSVSHGHVVSFSSRVVADFYDPTESLSAHESAA